MSNGTLFLVRSRGFDPLARLLAERLSSAGARVTVVADERDGAADTTPFDKIVLNDGRIASLGLAGLPPNWGWFCGDVCYYAAAEDRPGFERYALLDSDVYVSVLAAADLVDRLDAHPAEALAVALGPRPHRRRFSRGLTYFGLDTSWGCDFPVSRVSARLVENMLQLRRRQIAEAPDIALNDEAILAGAVLAGNFTHASLELAMLDLFPPECFATNPPHLLEALEEDVNLRAVHHPVVTLETLLARISTGEKNYSRHRLRKTLQTAPPKMRASILASLEKAEKAHSRLALPPKG